MRFKVLGSGFGVNSLGVPPFNCVRKRGERVQQLQRVQRGAAQKIMRCRGVLMTLRAAVIRSEPCESYSHARSEVLDRPM